MVENMKMKKPLLIILFVLAAVSLACNLGRRVSTPVPTIPVSTEAVESLEESVDEAIEEAQQTGLIDLEITESELTSIVALELEKSGTDSVADPQITLDDGQILISAQVNTSGLSARIQATMEVTIDGAGRPVFNVVSATLGPFPVPADLVSEVETRINRAFQDQIDERAPGLFIESIVIDGGSMRITGRTNS
jgi:hypothetical protein